MQRKTVLFNDLTALRQRSGVGCYTAQLMQKLAIGYEDVNIVPLSRTLFGTPLRWASQASATNDAPSRNEKKSRNGARRLIAKAVRKFGHDFLDGYVKLLSRYRNWNLYHEPDALPFSIAAPTVATFHDLSVILFPQWHPAHRVKKYEQRLRRAVDQTTHFVADSDATRRDMVAQLGIDKDRIRVVSLAARPEFRVQSDEAVATAKRSLDLPDEYFLFVGTIEPRKNVSGLLQAYGRLPDSLRQRWPLVLAGGWGWKSETVRQMLDHPPLSTDVRTLGFLSDDDLVAVVNGAGALVYPSFYEGFGLPPLEAMACRTPVITTHCGSLKEVVGDAALIVDPDDVDGLTDSMRAVAESPELADELREKGSQRARMFSWEKAAQQTLDVYRRAA